MRQDVKRTNRRTRESQGFSVFGNENKPSDYPSIVIGSPFGAIHTKSPNRIWWGFESDFGKARVRLVAKEPAPGLRLPAHKRAPIFCGHCHGRLSTPTTTQRQQHLLWFFHFIRLKTNLDLMCDGRVTEYEERLKTSPHTRNTELGAQARDRESAPLRRARAARC